MKVEVKDAGGEKVIVNEIDGYRIPQSPMLPAEVIEDGFRNMPNFKCRDDDILLCSFAKTGTNWMFEIIMMLLKGKAERIIENKVSTMLEMLPKGELDNYPSPRVLNSHCLPKYLPREVTEKKIKTVLVVRNPKDTAVSFYNHHTGLRFYNYCGKWQDWLQLYLNGECEYGRYEDYLLAWDKVLEDKERQWPIHLVYYEDLKEDCLKEVKRLCAFLELSRPDDLLKDIVESCSFKKMQTDKIPPPMLELMHKGDFHFFRKGEVGDWTNWFTVAQNESFDELWRERMGSSRLWNFKYTASPMSKF